MDFEKIKKIGDRKPKITPNIENLEEFKNFLIGKMYLTKSLGCQVEV